MQHLLLALRLPPWTPASSRSGARPPPPASPDRGLQSFQDRDLERVPFRVPFLERATGLEVESLSQAAPRVPASLLRRNATEAALDLRSTPINPVLLEGAAGAMGGASRREGAQGIQRDPLEPPAPPEMRPSPGERRASKKRLASVPQVRSRGDTSAERR